MGVGEFDALLVREMLPFAAPAALGANCVAKELACPGVSVSGSVSPVTLNPAPVTGADVIVKSALPVFVIVTV
jgi:hypothetical protein